MTVQRRRDAWQLWLRHHGAAACYRLVLAAAIAEGDSPTCIALLRWEAERHERLARKYRNRITRPNRQAA